MVIDSKLAGQGGAILRFQSSDLIHWTYQGLLQLGDQHPSRPDSDGVEAFCTAGRVRLISLDAWNLEA